MAKSLVITREMLDKALSGDERINELIYESFEAFIHGKVNNAILRLWNNDFTNKDDVLAEAHEAYWDALRTFDPDRGVLFISYMGKILETRIFRYKERVYDKYHRIEPKSLEVEISGEAGSEIFLKDVIGSDDPSFESLLDSGPILKELFNCPGTGSHPNILPWILLEGYSQEQVGSVIGIGQVQVSRIYKSQLTYFKKVLLNKGMVDPDVKNHVGKNRTLQNIQEKERSSRNYTDKQLDQARSLLMNTNKKYKEIEKLTGVRYYDLSCIKKQLRQEDLGSSAIV
ncbi:MAG: hypothetical protein Q8910_00735 [Bacteroidota bacterium]|nr:hypothetical protein [Bacteroidota bacterium]